MARNSWRGNRQFRCAPPSEQKPRTARFGFMPRTFAPDFWTNPTPYLDDGLTIHAAVHPLLRGFTERDRS